MSNERLLEHIANIRALNESLDGIELLAGSEVDIRSDGSLDYPDEILDQLDGGRGVGAFGDGAGGGCDDGADNQGCSEPEGCTCSGIRRAG